MGMTSEGEILRQLIINCGYGLGEFADKIGLARSTLSRIVNDKKTWGKVNDARFAEGLGLALGIFRYLIKQDIPLEQFKFLQEILAEKDEIILAAIQSLLQISKDREKGNINSEELNFLILHINKVRKSA